MESHDIFIVPVVGSNLRIKVAHADLNVTFRNLIYNGIELVVNVPFVLHLGSIGCRVTLDYGQTSNPFSKSGDDYRYIDKLPLHKRT